MKYIRVLCLLSIVLLSGCWDQRLLRDHSLVLSIGFDKVLDGGILETVTFPKGTGGMGKQSTPATESLSLSMIGETVKDAEKRMDQSIPEKFDRSKAKIILLGEELAEKGIFTVLDSLYRDMRGPLDASIIVFEGLAKDGLSFNTDTTMLISDMYFEIIKSAEKSGITVSLNVQQACPAILSEGKDLVLPYASTNEKQIDVKGLALFHNDQLTGTLDIEQSTMFLLLSNKIQKGATMGFKVKDDENRHEKDFVNISLRNSSRNIQILHDKGEIRVKILVNLMVEVIEYPSDHLTEKNVIHTLTKKIEEKLQMLAKKTLVKMQAANSDALGLGERVKAYHYSAWKQLHWKDAYPKIPIETTFNIKIVRHGIIN